MLANGLTSLGSALEFLEGNTTFQVLIGVAVAGIVVSVVLSLFFRR